MSSQKKYIIQTDYAVSFKEYVHEWLEETDVNLADVDAQLAGKYGVTLSDIMVTKIPLDAKTAEILANATEIPVKFWTSIDAQYHRDAKRLGIIIT